MPTDEMADELQAEPVVMAEEPSAERLAIEERFQKLKEQRAAIEEELQKEREAKKIDWQYINDLKCQLRQLNNLLEIERPDVKAQALEILQTGDPVEYIMRVYNRLHVGDVEIGKVLLLSIACQSVLNSEGIQPKITGSSGKGKTHAVNTMYHLIPDVGYKTKGSLSSKTLFYDPDLKPGTIIFVDDVKMSDDLDSTLKQAMSNFQEPTTHKTVINQEYRELTIPERTVFWMTAVNTDFSDELINRIYDLNVDESTETDEAVLLYRKERAGYVSEAFPEDEVGVCRAIIHEVKAYLFDVIIPYFNEIEWKVSKDRRNFDRFIDLIKGFAAMRFMQRPEIFEDVILASLKDFEDAKALYDVTSLTQVTKLTKAERRLAEWLKSKDEAKTINEMVEEYLKEDGTKFTYTAIYKCFKGTKGKGGLLDKVPGLLKVEKNGEEAFKLDNLNESAVGSIVTLAPEAYEKYS